MCGLRTVILFTIVLQSAVARWKRPRPNHVMGALQNIHSPPSAERTMQKRIIADNFGNYNPPCQPQIPVAYSPPILPFPEPCNSPLPIPIPANTLVMPNQMPVQLPTPMPLQTPNPMQVQLPNPISYQYPSQTPGQMQVQLSSSPLQLPVQLSNPVPIQSPSSLSPYQFAPIPAPLTPTPEIILERPPCPCEQEIIYPYAELLNYIYNPSISAPDPSLVSSPISTPVSSMVPAPVPTPIPELVPEVIPPVALTSAQDTFTCPLPSPAALFTLPAASPGSGYAQEITGSRSQYLRKIPIPPPTL